MHEVMKYAYQIKRNERKLMIKKTLVVIVAVLATLLSTAAASADTTHSPLVTTTCTVTHENGASVTVNNNKKYGTDWMYGWQVFAVAESGKTYTDEFYTGDQFRLKAFGHITAPVFFGQHHLSSCTAQIVWAS